jgi:replicative DNA helicase
MSKIPRSWSDKYRYEVYQDLANDYAVRFENEMEELSDDSLVTHIGEFKEDAKKILDNKEITGITTCYRDLDNKIKGFDKGELIIISGATGTGKTLFALNIIINSFKNSFNPILIFTLEMTKPQITARIMQILEEDGNEIELDDLPVFFYSSKREPNIKSMNKAVIEMKEKYGIAWIMIDHLHYFSRSIQNQVAELGILTRDIKRLAVNEKVPVLLLAQPRKKNNNDDPSLDDIKGASDITQDADTVIQLSREISDEEKSNLLEVYVNKNRNKGSLGHITMVIKPITWRLYESTRQDMVNQPA